ncbi:Hypothetical protein, putative [Bodo saltans]|uniref:Uncharacterized protein n=1 Tax=Bodo saltans TaxID=75058 RepID=A0A0S4JI08_BODSA|nr:Hypothetical protein, putative [Bodo saltans]|eukprot:CUG89783.1 Hypothetical protein, putative [Bodo saltans]
MTPEATPAERLASAPTAAIPQGYFVDKGRTVPPRVACQGEGLVSICAVVEGGVLWEESCEAVFGAFDPNNRAQLSPSTTDKNALIRSCPYVLANALLSKTSTAGGGGDGAHPLAQWLEGYDLLQRVLLHRTRRQLRFDTDDERSSAVECLGQLAFPYHNAAPLLSASHILASTPHKRWIEAGGAAMTVPVGVASMLVKGLERVAQALPDDERCSASTHEAGYLMYIGQHRRLLLCKGVPGPSPMLSRKESPWCAFGVFPYACTASQVRLKDAANCTLQVFCDANTPTIKVRCIATEALQRGSQIRIFCPRNGLIEDGSPCLLDSDALQPGSLLQLIRAQVLENTKPWRAQVDGQLSVIDAKLRAMLKQ